MAARAPRSPIAAAAAVLAAILLLLAPLLLPPPLSTGLLAAIGMSGAAAAWFWRRSARRAALRRCRAHLVRSRLRSRERCRSAVRTLACAVEAGTTRNLGHAARVAEYAAATAAEMGLDSEQAESVGVAALLHDIGRLGEVQTLLGPEAAPSAMERERAAPALGARLVSALSLPWPVAPAVRHQCERFDGTGRPDGLAGAGIPLAARIVAVADAYDAHLTATPARGARSRARALEAVEAGAGKAFDPAVVEALRRVANAVAARLAGAWPQDERETAAAEIAQAQGEVIAVAEMLRSVSATLQLSGAALSLAHHAHALVPSAACVVFLLESEREHLRAIAALGADAAHFEGAAAPLGAYLTGRAAARDEPVRASFMMDDLLLTQSAEPWTPLRSTLIAPLRADGQVVGTLNLYHTEPDAFTPAHERLMALVGSVAGRAIRNARLYTDTQLSACTDALTGLRNARYLHDYLRKETDYARQVGRPLAVLGLDLDAFKVVNDTCGHAAGDRLLADIGRLLLARVRAGDVVARPSGDEFVVVLPACDREQALAIGGKLRAVVERYGRRKAEEMTGLPPIGVSIGVAVLPEDGSEPDALLARADRAMYADKRARRAA
ncbi:MAG: diguanylate cyclase [Chthonomonadales bacterium]|nr:diguanylate cyclase [Chthonomonadales bacterium]